MPKGLFSFDPDHCGKRVRTINTNKLTSSTKGGGPSGPPLILCSLLDNRLQFVIHYITGPTTFLGVCLAITFTVGTCITCRDCSAKLAERDLISIRKALLVCPHCRKGFLFIDSAICMSLGTYIKYFDPSHSCYKGYLCAVGNTQ